MSVANSVDNYLFGRLSTDRGKLVMFSHKLQFKKLFYDYKSLYGTVQSNVSCLVIKVVSAQLKTNINHTRLCRVQKHPAQSFFIARKCTLKATFGFDFVGWKRSFAWWICGGDQLILRKKTLREIASVTMRGFARGHN